jgi:hypothetical protein
MWDGFVNLLKYAFQAVSLPMNAPLVQWLCVIGTRQVVARCGLESYDGCF